MRQVLLVIAGAPGRLAVSAAALATVTLTAAGHLPDLVVGAAYVMGWATVFALGFLVLAVVGNIAGVYDEAPGPTPAPERSRD